MKRKLLAKIASALSSLAILATATIPTLPSITPLVATLNTMAAVMLTAAAQVTKMAVPVGVMFVHQV